MEGTPNSRNLRIINNFLAINFVRTENVKLKYTTFVFESNGVLLGGTFYCAAQSQKGRASLPYKFIRQL